MPDPVAPALNEGQARAIALFNELFHDPDPVVRAAVRERMKKKHPEIVLPNDEIEPIIAPLREQNAALEKQIAEMKTRDDEREKKSAEQVALEKMQSAVEIAVKEYALTDEGKAKMLERMKDTGNYADAAAAAAWVVSKAPPKPAPLPNFVPQDLNLFGSSQPDEALKLLHTNPDKFLDKELTTFIQNPEQYTRETLGQGLMSAEGNGG